MRDWEATEDGSQDRRKDWGGRKREYKRKMRKRKIGSEREERRGKDDKEG